MLRDLVTALLPSGGQLHARRNAWAGMSEGAVRARARREADAALSAAAQLADLPGARAAR
ncbi:MAG: hypothetical protein JWO60_2197 [Frankiales bacterium]|nr:hypothetical protein [Frankiales bacterium]